jgi:4,5-DOPA dioxygenase extradiol
MNRKKFLKLSAPFLTTMPFLPSVIKLSSLDKCIDTLSQSRKMPVLFLGHGSPMNAIEENEFVQGFRKVSTSLPRPVAILCISAHWETKGTWVTAMENPKTIHDFGGFPNELFEVQYPAPGSPTLADEVKKTIDITNVGLDHNWGLDHGAWSVIKHLYPDADIPVIQMSMDYSKGPQYHFDLAKQLTKLRKKGVLIIGSGNMVHNLRMVSWQRLNESFAFDWAAEASEKMKSFILRHDTASLIDYRKQGRSFELAIPTPEHYYPLLYSLALREKSEEVSLFNDKPVAGSLTMTSVKIG